MAGSPFEDPVCVCICDEECAQVRRTQGKAASYRCSCWLQGAPVGLSWQSQHGGFTRAGPRVGCALGCSANPTPSHPCSCSHARECCHCPPPCQHSFTSSWHVVSSASSPANQPLCFSRDSICNVWRRFCLKLGLVLQGRVDFTTTPLSPNLCSGIQFDPNLWIFILWKESQTKLCWTSYSSL